MKVIQTYPQVQSPACTHSGPPAKAVQGLHIDQRQHRSLQPAPLSTSRPQARHPLFFPFGGGQCGVPRPFPRLPHSLPDPLGATNSSTARPTHRPTERGVLRQPESTTAGRESDRPASRATRFHIMGKTERLKERVRFTIWDCGEETTLSPALQQFERQVLRIKYPSHA